MSMDINATIIVQAIHFSLAYIALKKLFFTPAVAVVVHERKKEKALHDQMHACRTDMQHAEKRVTALWAASRQELSLQVPLVQAADLFVFKQIKPTLAAPKLDLAHERQLEADVAQALVSAVNHVR